MPSRRPNRRAVADWRHPFSYLVAVAIGIWSLRQVFPFDDLAGRLPPGIPPDVDPLQHMAGQVFFLLQPWHWPLLEATRLDAPHGVNIALTDSIPLVAVLLKLLHPLMPSVQQGIGPWFGIAWLLQPVAAVYALRGTGERGLAAATAVAIMAASLPTFLFRIHHAALDGHFLLLLALGLYARATAAPRTSRKPVALLAALIVVALFVHPYLMAMTGAVALAVPVTLAARGARREAAQAGAAVLAAIALAMLLAWLLGYLGGEDATGYGYYSMNLAAPFWPMLSWWVPGVSGAPVNATGGQLEGYQYLGAGLLALLACLLGLRRGRRWLREAAWRHPGLALALAALTAEAASTQIWLFHWCLLRWNVVPPGGGALRASGRLFWPVAYALLLAAVRGVSLLLPRSGGVVLLAAACLQLTDAATLRRTAQGLEHDEWRAPGPAEMRLDALVARARTLILQPRLECDANGKPAAMQAIFVAARHGVPVNTMYAARTEPGNNCVPAADTAGAAVLAPGVLAIAEGAGQEVQAWLWQQAGLRCGVLGALAVCPADGAGLAGLPVPAFRPPSPNATVTARSSGDMFAFALVSGWYWVEPWGSWASSRQPALRVLAPGGRAPVRVTLTLHAPPGQRSWPVTVHAGDRTGPVLARWTVGSADATYDVVLPPGLARTDGGRVATLTLEQGALVHIRTDPRAFGVGLEAVRVGS